MKTKNVLFVFLITLALTLAVYYQTSNKLTPIDCSKPLDVVYLTHDELKYASEISNKINGVVVIPEDNQLIARTEILECPNFDYSDYIKEGADSSFASQIQEGSISDYLNN